MEKYMRNAVSIEMTPRSTIEDDKESTQSHADSIEERDTEVEATDGYFSRKRLYVFLEDPRSSKSVREFDRI
jgi:hypothetical protein